MGTGYLKVATTSAKGNMPIHANIIIFQEENILHNIHTDANGITVKVQLDAPPIKLALDPDYTGIPYSTYSVKAHADGFATRVIHGVQIFDTIVSILPVKMTTALEDAHKEYYIPAHNLIEPQLDNFTHESDIDTADAVTIPSFVQVDSTPISFISYIQNIASQSIYPTWPPAAIEANIYAIISLALYKSSANDYDSNIQIYDNIAQIVGSVFNRYIQHGEQPLCALYSDGKKFTCPGLWQWGTVALAQRGYNALEILRHYYPTDVDIVEASNIDGFAPFPGYTLQEGMKSEHVEMVHMLLNSIRHSYPTMPKIESADGSYDATTTAAINVFQSIHMLDLDPTTGVVDKNTWYQLWATYIDCGAHKTTSSQPKPTPEAAKEHIQTNQLLTMFLLSQICERHAGCFI